MFLIIHSSGLRCNTFSLVVDPNPDTTNWETNLSNCKASQKRFEESLTREQVSMRRQKTPKKQQQQQQQKQFLCSAKFFYDNQISKPLQPH